MSDGNTCSLLLEQLSTGLLDGISRQRPSAGALLRALDAARVLRRTPLSEPLLRALCLAEGGVVRSASIRSWLLAHRGVVLGAWSFCASDTRLAIPPNTVIGRYCSIGPRVLFANENHPIDRPSTSGCFYDPDIGFVPERTLPPRPLLIVGHDVWIGAGACILPGCRRIGHGAVIGAGAVVTKDVAPLVIIGGNPAEIIRSRFPDQVALDWLASGWWRRTPGDLVSAGFTGATPTAVVLRKLNDSHEPDRTAPAVSASNALFDSLLASHS
jgi:virginiamycin A acetyltransferase